MKKLKIYLDTSVISHLYHLDAPDKMQDTLQLWKQIERGDYDVYLSSVTLDEISACKPDKLSILTEHLNEIKYNFISANSEIYDIAERIIDFGVLKRKSFDDCIHIASAIVSECDIIVSWNFKHFVNHKTIQGVKLVTTSQGYKDIFIYSPTFLIEGDEHDDE